jgi:hypothetical protein
MKKMIVFFASIALAGSAYSDFLPPNTLHLEGTLTKSAAGISQEEYNQILARVGEAYSPIIAQYGATLVMENKWDDPLVNANAIKTGNVWTVTVYGGLARRAEMNVDSVTLVACHEVGHHVGGFPYFRKVNTQYSDEGQADYFASQACADFLWRDEIAKNAESRNMINAAGKKLCDAVHTDTDEQNLCYRKALAGLAGAELLNAVYPGGSRPIDFATPATIKVLWTNHFHPYPQCRLDTYVAGALCTKRFDPNVVPKTETETANYTCTHAEKIPGPRPRCWFKPNSWR